MAEAFLESLDLGEQTISNMTDAIDTAKKTFNPFMAHRKNYPQKLVSFSSICSVITVCAIRLF